MNQFVVRCLVLVLYASVPVSLVFFIVGLEEIHRTELLGSPTSVDILVYGATPAGISAAIAAAEHSSLKVLLVEPSAHVGGMATEGGIGFRDGSDDWRSASQLKWGMLNAQHYDSNAAEPVWQPDNYVGEESFLTLLNKANVQIMFDTSIVEDGGAVLDLFAPFPRITKLKLQGPDKEYSVDVRYVIDTTYEGDIVLASGVNYTVGREPRWQYNESRAGVTNFSAAQFNVPVSPFHKNGRELVKYVQDGPDPREIEGHGDDNVMAYSYRVCLTADPENYAPILPPPGYNPQDFALVRRLVKAQLNNSRSLSEPWLFLEYAKYTSTGKHFMKFDACCGVSPVGIDATGLAKEYPLASRAKRAEIAAEVRYYVGGLMWFWQSDSSLPEAVRYRFQQYGLCKDEWPDNNHFPRQLYVREAIRLVGDQVFTQNDRIRDCRRDSIAVGTWGFDVHDVQRVSVQSDDGHWQAYNEGLTGDNHQGAMYPFDVPYSVLLPSRLGNLVAPNNPSVSHVAFSAIREEPTLWQLGQAAGVAASLAAQESVSFHHVNVTAIQEILVSLGTQIHAQGKCTEIP